MSVDKTKLLIEKLNNEICEGNLTANGKTASYWLRQVRKLHQTFRKEREAANENPDVDHRSHN